MRWPKYAPALRSSSRCCRPTTPTSACRGAASPSCSARWATTRARWSRWTSSSTPSGRRSATTARCSDIRSPTAAKSWRSSAATARPSTTCALSIDRWTTLVGPDQHCWLAYPLTALGKDAGRRRPLRGGDCAAGARRADPRARTKPNRGLLAESQFALARARWNVGRDRAATRALAVAARDGYRELPAQAKKRRRDRRLAGVARQDGRQLIAGGNFLAVASSPVV